MTPAQREAALRLADWLHASGVVNSEVKETIALLRELLAEPPVNNDVAWLWTHCKALGMKRKSLSGSMRDDIALYVVDLRELAEPQAEPMPGMSLMNRTIAYCAADTLRKLGYEWDGEAWVTTESQAEPVRECADNDSPWLICKPCAAVGRCAKLPVAWRSKERINGEFDSGWKLTSTEPPQTPRTIAIEPLYIHPPQQRKPLTDEFVSKVVRSVQPNLSDTCRAWKYEFAQCKHWLDAAHGIGEAP